MRINHEMTINIHYRGQLANAMGVDNEEIDIVPHSSIGSVLQGLAERGGSTFAEIALGADGGPRRTLMIAVDGEQVVDFSTELAPDVNEITLIPPIAGG